MAFHPYPQLIPPVFNLGGFGPPHALTRASTWPWVDHPASGPERATTLALFGLALATATPHGLTSRHATDSQAHSSKGTPPPPHTTSMEGSDGLQAPGFRYYFTPLPGYFSPFPHGTIHYRSSGGIQAAKWSWQIHTGFHEPRATRANHPRHAPTSSAYGGITHYATPSQTIQLPASTRARSPAEDQQDSPTTPHTQPLPSITRTRFNHHPLSLATTHGISSPTGTKMFHFPASPPTPYTIQMQVTRHNSCRVPPFGNPRITARQPAPRGISQATTSFIGP